MRSPGEVGLEPDWVLEQRLEIDCQVSRFWILESINIRVRRQELVIVGSSKHNGNGVEFEGIEGFLCDVIFTHRVLETEIEFIFPVNKIKAGVMFRGVATAHAPSMATPLVSAVAVYVNSNVFLEQADILHPAIVIIAVRHEPDNRDRHIVVR